MKKIDKYMSRGSCWILHELLRLDVHIYEYIPLRGSTYITLPKDLKAKQAVINIENNEKKCFIWCITLALYGDPEVHAATYWLPFDGSQNSIFRLRFKLNLSLNVF